MNPTIAVTDVSEALSDAEMNKQAQDICTATEVADCDILRQSAISFLAEAVTTAGAAASMTGNEGRGTTGEGVDTVVILRLKSNAWKQLVSRVSSDGSNLSGTKTSNGGLLNSKLLWWRHFQLSWHYQ